MENGNDITVQIIFHRVENDVYKQSERNIIHIYLCISIYCLENDPLFFDDCISSECCRYGRFILYRAVFLLDAIVPLAQ